MKVWLYEWDGKALTEVGTLEGNKGTVSAVAISPDGSHLAAGDVSRASHVRNRFLTALTVRGQSLLVRSKRTQGRDQMCHQIQVADCSFS